MKTKKFLAIFIALTMVFSFLTISAVADDEGETELTKKEIIQEKVEEIIEDLKENTTVEKDDKVVEKLVEDRFGEELGTLKTVSENVETAVNDLSDLMNAYQAAVQAHEENPSAETQAAVEAAEKAAQDKSVEIESLVGLFNTQHSELQDDINRFVLTELAKLNAKSAWTYAVDKVSFEKEMRAYEAYLEELSKWELANEEYADWEIKNELYLQQQGNGNYDYTSGSDLMKENSAYNVQSFKPGNNGENGGKKINPNDGMIQLADGLYVIAVQGSEQWQFVVEEKALNTEFTFWAHGNKVGEFIKITFTEIGEFLIGTENGMNHLRLIGEIEDPGEAPDVPNKPGEVKAPSVPTLVIVNGKYYVQVTAPNGEFELIDWDKYVPEENAPPVYIPPEIIPPYDYTPPPPVVELEFPEVPLAELDDPEVPLAEFPAEEEFEDLEFPEIPLGEFTDEVVELEFPEVPLAEMPQTGVVDMLWLFVIGLGLSFMGLTASAVTLVRKKD